jgi:hypothetical protein
MKASSINLVIIAFLFLFNIGYSQTYYPKSVVYFDQGLTNTNSSVLSIRSDSSKSLGPPSNVDVENGTLNFVSLGFGGTIIVYFETPIQVTPGTVIRLYETTYGYQCNSYPEIANVYVSKDSVNFVYLNQTCGNNNTVFYPYSTIDTIQYIKIIDVSPVILFSSFSGADAYDLDGIEISNYSPLPIVLGEFRMSYLNELISIYIKTMSESNSKEFIVEASEDLIQFRDVVSIESYGNSSTEREYHKTVNFYPRREVTYFRLSERDFNGNVTVHQILPVRTPTEPMDILLHYDLLGRETNVKDGLYIKIRVNP